MAARQDQKLRPAPRLPPPPSWASELVTVGVTGTNGKTTTTTLVASALASAGPPVPRVTTVGSFLGAEELTVPRDHAGFLATMRAGLDRGARFAAIELTSEALALGFAKAWPCHVGVFTNLSHDHLDSHRSAEHYLASKAQLFLHLPPGGTAVLNGLDPVSELLAEVVAPGVRIWRYGVASRSSALGTALDEPATPSETEPAARAADATPPDRPALDLWAEGVELDWSGTHIRLGASGLFGQTLREAGLSTLSVPSIGDVYAENALAALAAAIATGTDAAGAAAAIAAAPPPPGRFELLRAAPWVVLDYAHSPDALWRTLGTARQLCRGELWVVFGAGGNRDRDKREPMGRAARVADHVVLTSDNPRDEDPAAIAQALQRGLGAHPGVAVELDRAAAITLAVLGCRREDVVVVAGKGHELEQEIRGERRAFSDRLVVAEACHKRDAKSPSLE